MSNTLCAFVFVHTDIEPNGDIKFCCAAANGQHRDQQGQIYNVQTHTLKEAWNSKQLRETRLAMIRGEKPEICRYCWDMENEDNTLGTSMRLQAANSRNDIGKLKDRIEYARTHEGALSDEFLAYDFQLSIGNLCNLACKMCNGGFSTQWQKFYAKYHSAANEISYVLNRQGDPSVEAQIPFNTTFDWPIKQDLTEIFKDHTSSLRLIFFTGGEPTLIPEVITFIDHLADQPHDPNLTVWPSTNCTNINKKLLDSLAKHNRIWINMSLDGKDEIAYIQRTPSHWPSIEKNVELLMDWVNYQRKKLDKHIKINILSTVTALNFHHILDFWKYFDDRWKDNTNEFGSSASLVLDKNTNFGIEIIPKDIIPELRARLTEYRATSSPYMQRAYGQYQQFLETTDFADGYEKIHYCLDQVQRYHPDLNVRQIYSIYYK